MKPSRIAMATLGVGAALTAGVWTLSAAAVPLPADPIAIPVVGTPQPLNADPGITDPARAVADAEARLLAMNGQLQALVRQRAPAVPAAARRRPHRRRRARRRRGTPDAHRDRRFGFDERRCG